MWKLLNTIKVGPVARVGTGKVKGLRTTEFKILLSTARFVELQGVTAQEQGTSAPQNPIQMLFVNVASGAAH